MEDQKDEVSPDELYNLEAAFIRDVLTHIRDIVNPAKSIAQQNPTEETLGTYAIELDSLLCLLETNSRTAAGALKMHEELAVALKKSKDGIVVKKGFDSGGISLKIENPESKLFRKAKEHGRSKLEMRMIADPLREIQTKINKIIEDAGLLTRKVAVEEEEVKGIE